MTSRYLALTFVWALAVLGGFAWTFRYAATPGAEAAYAAAWPRDSALPKSPDGPTLVMFVHPRCACSRASLVELERLLDRAGDPPLALAVFARPAGAPLNWAQSDLMASATRIPGLRVVDDDGSVEAHRFGAETSGTTLLYAAAGKLLFAGGLTASRGHEGDSFGEERILAILSDRVPDRHDSPVFGCSLEEPRRKDRPQ